MILDWNDIDTVLLDMDGTLLDRHFDDHFWLEHVPKRWAAKNRCALEEARRHLYALFRSQEKTLNWTDLDYWSEQLGLDIPVLKHEVAHLIAVHPFVVEFLAFIRSQGKNLWLVTNAHSKTLSLKMKRTSIGGYFNGVISAHQVGLPKEDADFWKLLTRFISYEPAATLLGEDSETNLETARQYGIAYLIFISRYSSAISPVASRHFHSLDNFGQLIPEQGTMTVNIPDI